MTGRVHELLFVAHGQAPDPAIVRWQDRLLLQRRKGLVTVAILTGKIDDLIEAGGFRTERLSTDRLKSASRTFLFIGEGNARPA